MSTVNRSQGMQKTLNSTKMAYFSFIKGTNEFDMNYFYFCQQIQERKRRLSIVRDGFLFS